MPTESTPDDPEPRRHEDLTPFLPNSKVSFFHQRFFLTKAPLNHPFFEMEDT